ncbi:cupin domain-containing protein [Natronomonas sp. LN261]|jgi:mannose-6-phosphate isomerase-like protein (cupin superfamily)|uniref:cupin domain-containing protein n=1 Tax=Natronomonas sp. LN261 TaxID=2750669 RepID=UPI0015EF6DE2|nr:cupin domain-containing protein [Natronomonas sp. LN261]
MSTYNRVNYSEVEPVSGVMHFLKEPLDSDRLGVTIAQCDPNWQSRPHDHSQNNHEEIYVLIEGKATVIVGDDPVPMEAGDAIRIPPEATRQIRNGEIQSIFVLISAAECKSRTDTEPEWNLDGVQG